MHRRSITNGFAEPQSAQALVEFALILPVLLILVLGSLDIGRALLYGVAVQDGAREAARLGTTARVTQLVTAPPNVGDPVILQDAVVLQRLIDGSKPALGSGTTALGDCQLITTRQACGGGFWTFSIEVDTPTRPKANPWTVLNDGAGGGAMSDTNFSGSTLTVTAVGEVSLFPGAYFPVTAQGQAIMMVL
ncbi:MAG TPA: TadE/TadG family type IV pilus assembly protein [Chloroflexota bacterium]|nr:TadE/TadG family type IV pilus assembly protein [Chloroflexota bacterium]